MPEKGGEYMNPRKPTEEEKDKLVHYLWLHSYQDPLEEDKQEQHDFVERAAIVVFDHYITDCPGYAGKVMVVIWPAGPGYVEVFTWDNGQIERCPIEQDQ